MSARNPQRLQVNTDAVIANVRLLTAARASLALLDMIRLTGDQEQARAAVVADLRDALPGRTTRPYPPVTAPVHRSSDLHPTPEETDLC